MEFLDELRKGVTGLHLAALFGLEIVVRAMLKPGHDTSTAKDSLGRTPLDWTIKGNHKAVEKLLRNHDAVTTSNEIRQGNRAWNRTQLHKAAIQGDYELTFKLLNEGASINAKDSNGETALNIAFRLGWVDIANLLLERSASTTGITAIGLRKMYEKDNSDVLHLAQSRDGKSLLNFLSDSDTANIETIVGSPIENIDQRHRL